MAEVRKLRRGVYVYVATRPDLEMRVFRNYYGLWDVRYANSVGSPNFSSGHARLADAVEVLNQHFEQSTDAEI